MLFRKSQGIHIDGRKAMSKTLPIESVMNPKFVYIHLLQQNSPLKRLVEVGDLVKLGQVVAKREGFGEMPIHASVSGKVTGVKKVWHSSGRMVDSIEIENDFQNTLDDSIFDSKTLDQMSKQDLIDRMKTSGLSGLGGAGFPTYVKYQSNIGVEKVIINAVECEPYLTCDYMMFQTDPEKLLRGTKYLMKAAGSPEGVIAFKKYNHSYTELLQGLLVNYPGISLFPVEDVYPAGWEKYLVERIMGKTYKKLPAEVGCIVDNLQTTMAFADVIDKKLPLVSRAITITGEGIKQPRNFIVPIGTKVSELVALCGGYAEGLDPKDAYYIAGGPMTGRAILIDDLIVNDTLGGVIVAPVFVERDYPSCLGCGKCNDVCPVFLSPTEIERALEQKDTVALKNLAADKCIQCGLCSYICPSHVDNTDLVMKAKDLLRKGA